MTVTSNPPPSFPPSLQPSSPQSSNPWNRNPSGTLPAPLMGEPSPWPPLPSSSQIRAAVTATAVATAEQTPDETPSTEVIDSPSPARRQDARRSPLRHCPDLSKASTLTPAPFEALVSQLMSYANEQRSQAEALFNLCRDRHPDALALKLAHLLHSFSCIEICTMSAILLCKVLTRGSSSSDDAAVSPSYLWPRLSPATQSSLKSLLLSAVQHEDSKSIAKKLCDTISELASSLLLDDGWPELLPFMFQAVTSTGLPHPITSSIHLLRLPVLNRPSLFQVPRRPHLPSPSPPPMPAASPLHHRFSLHAPKTTIRALHFPSPTCDHASHHPRI